MTKKARVIAMYLPQYHPIPLNDEWWGPGFTEWTNVASAKPLFKGHNQPRIPADLGFYDLRLPETREAQAALAKEAGIEGFMYWHYWFGKGKQLLERPFNEVLESGKPDFPFCLGWANHSWSRKTWTAKNGGNAGTMAVEQTYNPEEYADHFYDVLPAFKDPRYINVDGKPFFLIYNVLDIPDFKLFMNIWNDLAVKNGLKGIHFVGNIVGHTAEDQKEKIFNSGVASTVLSNLFYGEINSKGRIGTYWQKFKTRILKIGPERYNYGSFIKGVHNEYEAMENVYPVVYPQLDRTPRAGRDAVILTGSTPKLFGEYLKDTLEIVKNKPLENRFVFINAWNEWGEGMFIEPDQKWGHGYLDAVKDALVSETDVQQIPAVSDKESYELYQDFVDEIFGKGLVTIKQNIDNNVIGTLKYLDEFCSFKQNFKSRLLRLKDKFENTPSYGDLLNTVAQVADSKNWEGAYAELVAYDVLSNDCLPDPIELNKTLPVNESYAGELCGCATNEDGYIAEYGLYFDVKRLADTTGEVLKGVIDYAIGKAGLEKKCDILPEYPLDDDESDYQLSIGQLRTELTDYLQKNIPSSSKGDASLNSKVRPHLTYRIHWGSGVNSSTGEYNPYRHAEQTKHLVYKRYTKKIMKNDKFMLVLVNFPWYNQRVNSFINADEAYYRSLARRTFCGYMNSDEKMNTIVPSFTGSQTVFDVSKDLTAIMFIDDHSVKTDTYSCHLYYNPNANHKVGYGRSYLNEVVRLADDHSIIDNFECDNY